ncbi:mandelate racemase/muconate lactonizing enzyme family protein [Pseudomonas oryzihabitans]|uniref:mandelate racemase/muconate lactonizing enzyme family protein n=1 Tax=Pseudomonas oryzihabitans TaxID=47885 RepID=UPI00123B1BB3|nr:enolase C-terminal domain-like protein [Pseudomonas oryzihabitans]QEU01777.1 L-alanine-DL-glutamate epimerase [Pseudomonas oryzihabitans]
MKTTRIDWAECHLPLPRPIVLGPVRITTRNCVALRIHTDKGIVGEALGYTRGTPLFATLKEVAPSFLGISPHSRKSIIETFLRGLVNGRPSFVRAVSLIDIALTDIAAKSAQLPLFRMLGGDRHRVPLMSVVGYYLTERDNESVRDEIKRRVDEGYTRIKMMIRGNNIAADESLIEMVAPLAPGMIGADAHWAWQTLPEALATCRRIDGFGLRFIEDPFGPSRNGLLARLQSSLSTPLAAGEDMPDIDSLVQLANVVGALRVDATTCGGVSAAVSAIVAGGLRGCEILPHVHTEIHTQLAGAFSEISCAEITPPDVGADPLHMIQKHHLHIEDGFACLSEEPGAGLTLDWEAVERHAFDVGSAEFSI